MRNGRALDAEVIVVGAGPGGSAAAFFLAQRGRRVLLLDRKVFPRDKSCGDGLTRPAVRILREMGVLPHLAGAQRVRGVRLIMRQKGSRDFEYPDQHGALVVPRLHLDEVICRQAVSAGAELWEDAAATRLIYEQDVVAGVEVLHGGERKRLRASVVVAADGAASRLALQAGLLPRKASERDMGFAIRGYYTGMPEPMEFLEIYTPLLDMSDRYLLPSYGWVFPTGPTSANIGVGLFRREFNTNVRELFEQFMEALKARDPRIAAGTQAGPWKGAPLRFDFSGDRCLCPGMLLVGDAAGLVSPFTGEGISYALESGKIAAKVIDRGLNSPGAERVDLSPYRRLLEKAYTGYFETGRQSARRYLLMWHVLDGTFWNDKPLFALSRQAVIFPEGMGESYTASILDNVRPLVGEYGRALHADLLTVGDILVDTVRADWPFLARLAVTGQSDPGVPFRPALLVLLASYLGTGSTPRTTVVGAAIELGYLAALAELSVIDDPADGGIPNGAQPANWGNMFAVIVGDFLLSNAYALSARAGAGVSQAIAEALARACEGQVRKRRNAHYLEQSQTEYIAILAQRAATLFELPCSLGSRLAGASEACIRAMAAYGTNLGIAFQLTDDILALTGDPGGLAQATRADIREGNYSLPVLLALQQPGAHTDRLRAMLSQKRLSDHDLHGVERIVRESGAADQTRAIARDHAERATESLVALGNHPVRPVLSRLAEYAVSRRAVRRNE